ncbi:MAG: hypothetical protein WD512_09130 [Candidatus Paceibacterota bacterium]
MYNDKISIEDGNGNHYNFSQTMKEKIAKQEHSAQAFGELNSDKGAIAITKYYEYNDYYNLVSDLYHEKQHLKYYADGYMTGSTNEMSVYIDQFKHNSWKNTTPSFQFKTRKSFTSLLNGATHFGVKTKDYAEYFKRMKNDYEKFFDTKFELNYDSQNFVDPKNKIPTN